MKFALVIMLGVFCTPSLTGCAAVAIPLNIAAATLLSSGMSENHAKICADIARQAKADKVDEIETKRRLSAKNCN